VGNRFQIGVGLRWAQVLGLALCCLAVANQNLASKEGDSCEQMLSAMHWREGGTGRLTDTAEKNLRPRGSSSLWRPLRVSTFRSLLVADVVADVGAFMQNVGLHG
jgi:hypothetical protein